MPSNILRTEGLATQAMVGSMVGSVANIILDPIFIFVLGFGVKGAAIATVLGQMIAMMIGIWITNKKSKKSKSILKIFLLIG